MTAHQPDTPQQIFISRSPDDAAPFVTHIATHAPSIKVISCALITTQVIKPFPHITLRKNSVLFFTSRIAAQYFLSALQAQSQSDTTIRQTLSHIPLCVVGPATRQTVESFGLPVTFESPKADAVSAAQAFLAAYPKTQQVLWPCGNLANPNFKGAFSRQHIPVQPLIIYKTEPITAIPKHIKASLSSGANIIALTSPSSVRALQHYLTDSTSQTPSQNQPPRHPPHYIAIGPSTQAAILETLGQEATVAHPHTLQGLAEACLNTTRKRPQ